MATDPKTPEFDFIPVIEQTLDNGMAGVMLICGAIAGAFALWTWIEYQKSVKAKTVGIAAVPYPQLVEVEQFPQVRGDNGFSAFAQGQAGS